jgi:hypothetical protein
MMAEEVIPPLLSVEEENASDGSDSDFEEKLEELMGISRHLATTFESIDF